MTLPVKQGQMALRAGQGRQGEAMGRNEFRK